MADKKAPQFRSKAEQKKWESLHHKAGHSLQQIAEGKATPADIQNVDKTLSGMSKLAKSVFSDAVKAAEQEVAAVQKANLKKTKEDQEAFEKAVGTLLQQRFPDLLREIQDIIEIESLEQDDRFGKTLSSKLEAFSTFLPPKDLPTTDDVVAIHEASLEQQSTTEDRKWESRQKKLLDTFTDRVGDVVKATILSMAMAAVSPTSAQQTATSGVPQLVGPKPTPSVAKRGLSMLAAPRAPSTDVIDVEARTIPTSTFRPTTQEGTPLLPSPTTKAAGTGVTVSLSRAAEEAILQAASAQTKLHEQIRDMLASTSKGIADKTGVDDTQETKKADAWWRSFGKWVGDKYESVASKVSDAKSWLGTLATGLTSVLLAPKLYETLAQKAHELLTWDNIKDAADKAWTSFYTTGKSVVDWVVQKLGLQPAIDKAESVFSKISDGVKWIANKLGYKEPTTKPHFVPRYETDPRRRGTDVGGPSQRYQRAPYTAAQKAEIADINEKSLQRLGLGVKRGTTVAGTVAGAGIAGAASYTGTNIPVGIQAQTEAESVIYNDLRSVASALWTAKSPTGFASRYSGKGNYPTTARNTTTNVPTTTSVPNTPVRTTPSVTVPVAGSVPASAVNARPVAPSQSTSIVGLNSFGINSGVDDTLALLNLGVLAG